MMLDDHPGIKLPKKWEVWSRQSGENICRWKSLSNRRSWPM